MAKKKKGITPEEERRRAMDSLSLGFCDRLYMVNGLMTEIAAGHVVSIRKEAT